MTPAAHIDFETKSEVDLKKVGLHNYATHPSTDVWCMSFAIGEDDPLCWRPDQPQIQLRPWTLHQHTEDGGTVVAHNAQFEMAIWHHIMMPRYGWPPLKLEQVRCTMAAAYAMSLPGSLEMAGAALGLPVGKDKTGHALMMKMCRPAKYQKIVDMDDIESSDFKAATADSKTGGEGYRPVWVNELQSFTFMGEKVTGAWALDRLCQYCDQDVATEREIDKRLVQLSPRELHLWRLDQKINARGIHFDMAAIKGALAIRDRVIDNSDRMMCETTSGAVGSTTALPALKTWLADYGVIPDSLDKEHIGELVEEPALPAAVKQALELRRTAGRATSVKKLDVIMLQQAAARVRYLFQYHGAGTGRWAGRHVQPHNLPRDLPKPLELADIMQMLVNQDMDLIEILYGDPLTVISQCLRGFIIAAPGKLLLGGDWSSIEGRGIAWLAGEEWKLDAFRECDANPDLPDMYERTYAATFGIDPAEVTDKQRQVGKVEELAFGYEGGLGAWHSMGGTKFGLPDDDVEELKDNWRRAHSAIAGDIDLPRRERGGLWRNLERSAIQAVREPGSIVSTGPVGRQLKFKKAGSFLWMLLPSGRALCYPYPQIRQGKWGSDMLTYKTNPSQKEWKEKRVIYEKGQSRNWARVGTYGGKFAENATQAICRDILAECIISCEAAGLPIIKHVHDEPIAEGAFSDEDRATFHKIMNHQPEWAAGFPIAADTWMAERYQK